MFSAKYFLNFLVGSILSTQSSSIVLPVLQICDGDLDANPSFYGEPTFMDRVLKKQGYEDLLFQEEVTIDGKCHMGYWVRESWHPRIYL